MNAQKTSEPTKTIVKILLFTMVKEQKVGID